MPSKKKLKAYIKKLAMPPKSAQRRESSGSASPGTVAADCEWQGDNWRRSNRWTPPWDQQGSAPSTPQSVPSTPPPMPAPQQETNLSRSPTPWRKEGHQRTPEKEGWEATGEEITETWTPAPPLPPEQRQQQQFPQQPSPNHPPGPQSYQQQQQQQRQRPLAMEDKRKRDALYLEEQQGERGPSNKPKREKMVKLHIPPAGDASNDLSDGRSPTTPSSLFPRRRRERDEADEAEEDENKPPEKLSISSLRNRWESKIQDENEQKEKRRSLILKQQGKLEKEKNEKEKEKERQEAEREKQQKEREKQQKEREKQEQERKKQLERERQQKEKERQQERERQERERERQEKEREKQRERARQERERERQENERERQRKEREKQQQERERQERERREMEKEKQNRERERLKKEREQQEKERREREALKAKREKEAASEEKERQRDGEEMPRRRSSFLDEVQLRKVKKKEDPIQPKKEVSILDQVQLREVKKEEKPAKKEENFLDNVQLREVRKEEPPKRQEPAGDRYSLDEIERKLKELERKQSDQAQNKQQSDARVCIYSDLASTCFPSTKTFWPKKTFFCSPKALLYCARGHARLFYLLIFFSFVCSYCKQN
ncbi:trichohyalin-like isoform X7 [Penaeus indicus]|uniref:trichohyalin-like isoform X7 n=1 Tax=Penaeus indicus TaxID=29960 RepID=UPI00300D249D